MIALRRLSIRNKIIAIVLLATIVPLVGGFAFVVVNERRAFRREMLDNWTRYLVAHAEDVMELLSLETGNLDPAESDEPGARARRERPSQ